MSNLAFARKYRPQNFDEIIDQDHIATTLKNAIIQHNFAHAYLFSGPRGIGKTSTARILAKALNCKTGPTALPCDKCLACQEITAGRSLDVLEIDGASNRGIDEIRTLRENVKFIPTACRFKIYIIDEVHMLTTEAFNALLKTLEEPPAHVKFIFATTEPHKVLPTILSRCQRFDFHKITIPSIVAKLKDLSQKEKIKIEEEALFAIAKSAEGSLRDAEVILEQMNSFSRGKIKLEDVNSVLGLVCQDVIFKISDKLNPKHIAENLGLLDKLIKDGKDPAQLVISLIEHFRNMMLTRCGCEKLVALPKEDKAKLTQQTDKFSSENILYAITVLSGTQERIKRQGLGQLFLEMALVKLSSGVSLISTAELMEKLKNVEEKLLTISVASSHATQRSNTSAVKAAVNKQPDTEFQGPKEKKKQILKDQQITDPDSKVKTDTEPKPQAKVESKKHPPISLDDVLKFWGQIIQAAKDKKMSLGLYLAEGQPIRVHRNIVEVGFLREYEFHRENLEQKDNLKIIERISSDIIGQRVRIELVICDELPGSINLVQNQPDEAQETLNLQKQKKADSPSLSKMNEFIQSAMDIFNGHIVQTDE